MWFPGNQTSSDRGGVSCIAKLPTALNLHRPPEGTFSSRFLAALHEVAVIKEKSHGNQRGLPLGALNLLEVNMELVGVGIYPRDHPKRLLGIELSLDVSHRLAVVVHLEVRLLAATRTAPTEQGAVTAVVVQVEHLGAVLIIHVNPQVAAGARLHRGCNQLVRQCVVDVHLWSTQAAAGAGEWPLQAHERHRSLTWTCKHGDVQCEWPMASFEDLPTDGTHHSIATFGCDEKVVASDRVRDQILLRHVPAN